MRLRFLLKYEHDMIIWSILQKMQRHFKKGKKIMGILLQWKNNIELRTVWSSTHRAPHCSGIRCYLASGYTSDWWKKNEIALKMVSLWLKCANYSLFYLKYFRALWISRQRLCSLRAVLRKMVMSPKY